MVFIDELIITAKAGDGGNGVVRWRHEKFREFGGPGGGNGGAGGDVYIRCVRDRSVLAKYRSNPSFFAERGEDGGNDGKEGKDGKDIYIDIPIGSIVTNLETGEVFRVDHEGDVHKILSGGVGGLGNEHFKSSRNTTPKECTLGTKGEEGTFKIDMELIADAGMIGFPNAGKSSFLNALTNAQAKIGAYPFTTLEPNLGVMDGFVLADIPGLIEGASEGKGLGHRFLKHITRTKILLHLISVKQDNPLESHKIICSELEKFNPILLDKKEIIFLSQVDEVSENEWQSKLGTLKEAYPNRVVLPLSILQDELIKKAREVLLKELATV